MAVFFCQVPVPKWWTLLERWSCRPAGGLETTERLRGGGVGGGGAGGGGAEPRPSDRITPVIGGRGLDGTGGTHGNFYWPCHDHVIGPRFRRSRLAYRHETTIDADGRRRRSLFDILPTALGRDQQQQQMTIDQEGSFPFFFWWGRGRCPGRCECVSVFFFCWSGLCRPWIDNVTPGCL